MHMNSRTSFGLKRLGVHWESFTAAQSLLYTGIANPNEIHAIPTKTQACIAPHQSTDARGSSNTQTVLLGPRIGTPRTNKQLAKLTNGLRLTVPGTNPCNTADTCSRHEETYDQTTICKRSCALIAHKAESKTWSVHSTTRRLRLVRKRQDPKTPGDTLKMPRGAKTTGPRHNQDVKDPRN